MLFICLSLLQNPEDKQRFEEFYNKFYDMIFYIAKERLNTIEAAEDCAQEVMMRFAKDFHKITQDFDDKKFKNYVRVVSKGVAIDVYRREKKHLTNVVDADISEFYDIADEEFDVCDVVLLKEAIDAMPELYRYVFYLKYIYGLSGAEIAEKLNISKTLVRQRCMLGKQFVREFVKEAERK